MAINMPQTVKAQTNVASAQKTANNETAQKPVTFNTASNTTNNVQEKTAPAVQPQTTETVNNEAAVKPQQPVASQSVAQGSAKTICHYLTDTISIAATSQKGILIRLLKTMRNLITIL